MRKLLSALLLAGMFLCMLTGCGSTVPRPEVKEGEFDVTITYEVNGEVKTLDLVYVCEYDRVAWTLEGTRYRAWNGNFVGYEDGNEMIIDDQEFIAEEYGVKVIGCEYSKPIKNSFN